jgi:metal-responsive CopG/Arc/MetJ family transcriptional regulator
MIHHMAKRPAPSEDDGDVQRLSVSLPKELYSEVQTIATRDSRSLAWVVRKALEKLVADEQQLFRHNPREK